MDTEALCAAAYDCKPEGRRLVGLPPPLVRALEAVARAAEDVHDSWLADGRDGAGLAELYALERAVAKLREVRRG